MIFELLPPVRKKKKKRASMAIGDRSSPSPLSVNFFQGASSASESESEDSSPATPVEALPQQQQHQQFLQQHSHIHAPRPVRRNNSLGKGDVRKAVDAAHKTSASVAHAAANASASAMLGARKLRRWEACTCFLFCFVLFSHA